MQHHCHGTSHIAPFSCHGDLNLILDTFEEFLRCFLVAPALHQDIEDVVVLIHGPPEVIASTIDGQKRFVHVPLVTRPRAP